MSRLATPPGRVTRPTSARIREALFNILDGGRFDESYRNRLIVDAFAGTGALGLEALSRGAEHAVFIEYAAVARLVLQRNIDALGFQQLVTVFPDDATLLHRPAPTPTGLIMLDPPYRSGLSGPCLAALHHHGWTAAGTLVVLQLAADEQCVLPDWLTLADERRYGATRLIFARVV